MHNFFYDGFRSVDLFFILSGFILMYVHGADFRRLDRPAIHDFYLMRFFRIYPLNTVILIALLPIGLAMPDVVQWFRFDRGVPIPYQDNYFSALGFVQSLFLAQTWTVLKLGIWNGPAWSLSAEVCGYAMFPFLAYALMRCRSVRECVAIAVGSLSILVVLLIIGGHTSDNPTGSFGLIRMIFCFIAGMALACCFQRLPMGIALGTPITIASVLFIIGTVLIPAANMLVIFGFAGLVLGLAFRQGPVSRAMESRPAMFMGKISFSFYMIHYIPLKLALWLLVTRFANTRLGFRVAFLVALVASCVGLAIATFYLFEQPFQRLGSRMVQRMRDRRQRVGTRSFDPSEIGPIIEVVPELPDLGVTPIPLG